MNETIDSELSMVTNKAFNNVMHCVQNSGLNYQIKLSPFSAVISVKKSLLKNKAGFPIVPSFLSDSHETGLVMEFELLKRKYEDLLSKHTQALEAIETFQSNVDIQDQSASKMLVSNEFTHDSSEVMDRSSDLDETQVDFGFAKMKPVKECFSGVDNFIHNFETTKADDCKHIIEPHVAQPTGTGKLSFADHEVCSMCYRVMPKNSSQYYCGYKLRPACDICRKQEHLDQEPRPFSAFPSCEIPSSLVSHWVNPHRISLSQSISSSVSLRSHCVKWPNPGQVLYTAEEILRELKELMKNSKWWT